MAKPDPTKPAGAAAELPPDLAALEAVADAADQRNAGPTPEEIEQTERQKADAAQAQQLAAVASQADDMATLLRPVFEGIRTAAPWTARRLTDDWVNKHAYLVSAVLVKRGIEIEQFLTPEWALGGSLLITAFQLSGDAKAYRAWLEQQQRQAGPTESPAPPPPEA